MNKSSNALRPLALITGAAGGLGQATAKGLIASGCDIVLADINISSGEATRLALSEQFPEAQVSFVALDLSSLPAIEKFCEDFQVQHPHLDILVNNAGLFPTLKRKANAQDCELGFSVGFYGHFALTAQLLPMLLAAPAPRVGCVA